jgi:hypothetical protein
MAKKLCAAMFAENGSTLIQVQPRNQLVRKGDSAQFDCVYQNVNITEWYFKGKTDPISKNSTRYSQQLLEVASISYGSGKLQQTFN